MTILAVAIGPDGTWIGADGQAQVDDMVTAVDRVKWIRSPCGNWALGGSGVTTFRQIFSGASADFWPAVGGFSGAQQLAANIRSTLREMPEFEPLRESGDPFSSFDYSPLIVTRGAAWRFYIDLIACSELMDNAYFAEGSGQMFAFGAMSALFHGGVRSAEELVTAAVSTACRLSTSCGGVQRIEKL